MYIVIEGIDTAGKSTQLDILRKKYPTALFTKEPGGTALGQKIRQIALNGEAQSPLAEMFLFLADRAEHHHEVVLQNQDKMIISDRGFISGIAYAKDFDMQTVIDLNLIALDQQLPQKVIMLELSQEELEYRLSQKQQDGIELRGIEYLMDIQHRMKHTIQTLQIDALIIDAKQSIQDIEKQIEDFIQ
ncbi:MAG: dTMP kinase [Campylobacterota bacterium]|nr:dTMP kinase [Campylobacterota bacterium]